MERCGRSVVQKKRWTEEEKGKKNGGCVCVACFPRDLCNPQSSTFLQQGHSAEINLLSFSFSCLNVRLRSPQHRLHSQHLWLLWFCGRHRNSPVRWQKMSKITEVTTAQRWIFDEHTHDGPYIPSSPLNPTSLLRDRYWVIMQMSELFSYFNILHCSLPSKDTVDGSLLIKG